MRNAMKLQACKVESKASVGDYDVFVAPSGAVVEYGANRMNVRGTLTPCDVAALRAHLRCSQELPFPLVQKREVKVMGVRLS